MNAKTRQLFDKARRTASSQSQINLLDAIEAFLEDKPVSTVRANAPKKKAGAKPAAPVPASEQSAS